jgi:hypothetical protein
MRILCHVEETEFEGDSGRDVPGVRATCGRCGHETEAFGTGEGSINRCLAAMRKECPWGESNFYAEMPEPHIAPDLHSLVANKLRSLGLRGTESVEPHPRSSESTTRDVVRRWIRESRSIGVDRESRPPCIVVDRGDDTSLFIAYYS